MQLWLKQYLSIFFDFENIGNLNWIAIPLLIYLVATVKKRKRWELALAFVFVCSCVLLGVKGHGWLRYILTLFPFTLTAILLLGWEFIKKRSRMLQIFVLLLCGILVFLNVCHYREKFRSFWDYKVAIKYDPFPHELLKAINDVKDLNSESVILVAAHSFSLHSFFYHTDKKGMAYPDSKMDIYYHRRRNLEEDLDILKNQLKIKYIYLDRSFIETDWRFGLLSDVITNYGDLVYQEKGGYLYRLRDRDLDKQELEELFVNDSVLRNGSFEHWSNGPLKNPDYFRGGETAAREEKEVKVGQFSAKVTGDNFNFVQELSNYEDYKGKTLTCFVWMKTDVPNKYRIQIYDGVVSSFSDRHLGNGDWALLQANHTVNPFAEFVKIRVIQAVETGKIDDVVYVDGALLVEGKWNTFYQYRLNKQDLDR